MQRVACRRFCWLRRCSDGGSPEHETRGAGRGPGAHGPTARCDLFAAVQRWQRGFAVPLQWQFRRGETGMPRRKFGKEPPTASFARLPWPNARVYTGMSGASIAGHSNRRLRGGCFASAAASYDSPSRAASSAVGSWPRIRGKPALLAWLGRKLLDCLFDCLFGDGTEFIGEASLADQLPDLERDLRSSPARNPHANLSAHRWNGLRRSRVRW